MNPWQQWPLQTAAQHAPYMLGLAFDAPLMVVSMRWPRMIHAVTLEGVIDGCMGSGRFVSACGRRSLRLVGREIDGRKIAVLFPPRLKGMPEGMERCNECWVTTGRRRPRSEWAVEV